MLQCFIVPVIVIIIGLCFLIVLGFMVIGLWLTFFIL
jgi:hypothetical protein